MSTSSSRRRCSGPVLRSLSPSGRFQTAHSSGASSASFASSTSSSFYSTQSAFFDHHQQHNRPSSPTRVNLASPMSTSFKFAINNRSESQNQSRSVTASKRSNSISAPKKSCLCSPTNHPGSFRCSLHKNSGHGSGSGSGSYQSNGLNNTRRSAMANSLVRIRVVEGEWVKRALSALIRPSSHHQKRREGFQPKPSPLSAMSKADDL